MRTEIQHIYEFESFRLDLGERQLIKNDLPLRLTPKAFDVLALLVERSGHLVEKEDLMLRVWPDAIVEESNISKIIHTLRNALGENESDSKFIETVARKGYRFVADVRNVSNQAVGDAPTNEAASYLAGTTNSNGLSRSTTGPADDRDEHVPSEPYRSRSVLVSVGVVILALASAGFVYRYWQPSPATKALTPQTTSIAASQHYQRGRFLMENGPRSDIPGALASFEKAIALDPNYAGAYAGKADAKTQMFWGPDTNDDDMIQGRTAVEKAIELDPTNSYAQTVLCRIKGAYDWDFEQAEKACLRAVELDPYDHQARRETAFLYNVVGREDDAMRSIDAAVTLSMAPYDKRSRGLILYFSRRYDEAIAQLKEVEQSGANDLDTQKWLMNAYEMTQDHTQALESRVRQMEQSKASPAAIAATRAAFAIDGWPGVLRTIISQSKLPSMATAAAYAQLGENDKAFEALDASYDRHSMMLITTAREPRFDPIRNDPRFDELLKRIRLK